MGMPTLSGLPGGPEELTVLRHAESRGNVADVDARSRGADRIDWGGRDADVRLSDRGTVQADLLAERIAALPAGERPTHLVASPFRRTVDTARPVAAALGLEVALDERLREKDMGVFSGMTARGVQAADPAETERAQLVGKLYYQPPGGESMADVVLRVRSVLTDLRHGFEGARVCIVTHEAVVMAFRYVLETMTEREFLDLDGSTRVANAGGCTYRRKGDDLVLAEVLDSPPE
jgi:broad specificity phosphatase PhoE